MHWSNWVGLAPLLLLLTSRGASGGLVVALYDNSALNPPARHSWIVQGTNVSFFPAFGPFSAEVTGMMSFPRPGTYAFDCRFGAATMAFVWVDGHLVCQVGAYAVRLTDTDNPLPVRRVLTYAFRAHIYFNPHAAAHVAAETPAGAPSTKESNVSASGVTAVGLSVLWGLDGEPAGPIPSDALVPVLSPLERERDELQRNTSAGWGNMLHDNMLAFTNLPTGAVLTVKLCQLSSRKCTELAVPDGLAHRGDAEVRVGSYASDRSYGQFYLAGGQAAAVPFGNVSIEFTAGYAGLRILGTPQGCARINCSDLTLDLTARYVWHRAGSFTVGNSSVTFAPLGLPVTRVAVFPKGRASGRKLILALGSGPVALSTFDGEASVEAVATRARAAGESHAQALRRRFTTDELAEVATVVEAAAMWTLVSTPAENGRAVLMPVSRAWSRVPPSHPDFSYVIFDWDNLFASLLAGVFSKEIAYSNVIQSFKAKAAEGYLANGAGGGYKDQDRTEPPVGAMVLLALYQRYRDHWLVELLFDDCLDVSDWFMRRRRLAPLGLIALGSYDERAGQAGDMQRARLESGLDNSPMYDGEFFNKTSGLMELYDVGMSSMVAREAYALAELADAIGRPEAALLRARGDELRSLVRAHLWDPSQGAFVNRFPDGQFSVRITPTSFYALLAGAADDDQAAHMVEAWLLNPKHFCIAVGGDFKGNTDDCYWGLPSVQASDPAFPKLGYWRGYVWGPMGLLTYWSLDQYAHVPAVARAKRALAKQMSALMLSQWRRHRHICENFGPHRDTEDCTGTRFYHWGALNGLLRLLEEGFWTPGEGASAVWM